MRIGRRTIMAAGTFFLAAATGHVMQNADSLTARFRGAGTDATLTQASLTSATTETAPALPPAAAPDAAAAQALATAVKNTLPDFPDLPRLDPQPLAGGVQLASRLGEVMSDYQPPMTAVLREYDTFGQVCGRPSLTLTHLKPAMIGVALDVPCHGGEILTISHSGMSFSALTGADGRFTATIPALAAKGDVNVRLEGGTELAGQALVPDLGSVSRFAVVTRGQTGLHLNAYVKGADFGAAGHLRPGNEGLPTLGLGGYLTRLGDPSLALPRLAEIFSQPARAAQARVELVAEVEPANCGRDLIGTTFLAEGTVLPATGAVSFAMPGCDAIGDRLVLDMGPGTAATDFAAAGN